MLKHFMEACLSIKFAYLDWLTCKKCLLGGHGKARRTVIFSPQSIIYFSLSFTFPSICISGTDLVSKSGFYLAFQVISVLIPDNNFSQ